MPTDAAPDWDACDKALQDLAREGAATAHPVAFHGLQTLLRAASQQSPAVQARLCPRWWVAFHALGDLDAERRSRQSAQEPPQGAGGATLQRLQRLVAALGAAPGDAALDAPVAASGAPSAGRSRSRAGEIRAVREHRQAWSSLSIERQLQRALAQAPEQAGPMNSHALVLQALARMNHLAPDYLQAFVAYVEALVSLGHADLGEGAPSGRPARLPKMQRSSAAKAKAPPRRHPTPARG